MKFTLARPTRPRNPMVAPALFRQAGRHRSELEARQRQDRRALEVEMRDAIDRFPVPLRTPPDPQSR